jgi:GNAT superfamily N-acetyltransferase
MSDILDFETPVKFRADMLDVAKEFDCGDGDLNEFLTDDALKYMKQNLATTYLCTHSDYGLLAYFSISADSIEISEKEKEIFREYDKALREYPAIKIGRLAVRKDYKRNVIGEKIIGIVIGYALKMNERLAVRYVSVDAYPESTGFYERCGFKRFKQKGDNLSMYGDIMIKE